MSDREQAELIVDIAIPGRDCRGKLEALRLWYQRQPATANHHTRFGHVRS
ncbi:hypothetical protein ACFPL7_22315 [Dongia soli]|uniref:Uncharacterized protein n=1 Tax=Dongia soli TaxID=600628 RepID=A0ABU5E812_9PROT|nr:hypothetical protein [Dongia soli]MDY0882326.1 hypothetical protein [Dongia soli]